MQLIEKVTSYPKTVIVFILLSTLVFCWKAKDIQFNNSIEVLLPENHPSLIQDKEIKEDFDSREFILIGMLREPDVFQFSTLQKVKGLSETIWEITLAGADDEKEVQIWTETYPKYSKDLQSILQEGLNADDRRSLARLMRKLEWDTTLTAEFLQSFQLLQRKLEPVSDVISLTEVDNITSKSGVLEVDKLMENIPKNDQMVELISDIYDNDLYVNGLVSTDSSGTLIMVELSFHYDNHLDLAYELFDILKLIAQDYEGPEEIHLAGVPMVNVYTSNYMNGDLAKLIPFATVVMIIILFITLRSVGHSLIPVIVVLISIIWTVGAMAMFDKPITLVVSAMPVILIAIGVADAIHIITEFRSQISPNTDKITEVRNTMHDLAKPLVYTTLTDMAGFCSLAISSLQSIKDFGIFTAVGALMALILSFTIVPALLTLFPSPQFSQSSQRNASRGLFGNAVMDKLTSFILRRKRVLVFSTLVLILGSLYAITKMDVGSTMVGYFKKSSDIYQSSQMLNEKFGGTEVMNIVVGLEENQGIKRPNIMKGIAAIQDTLESLPLIGYSTSIADYVRRVNYVMNSNDPMYNRVPNDVEYVLGSDSSRQQVNGRDQIGQYLFLYENAGGESLEKMVDFDYKKANIIAQIRTDDTPALAVIKEFAEKQAGLLFGPEVNITFAGCSTLCVEGDKLIITSQLKSLGLAIVVVMILLILIFRSVKLGVIGLLPLLITILLVFGIMSTFSVNLDAVTALIASIVLGVGIDYSIHFISRLKKLEAQGMQGEALLQALMHTSGRAIIYNSVAVSAGFLVLIFASFWPIIHIGWMVGATMILGALLVLFILPIFLINNTKTKEP